MRFVSARKGRQHHHECTLAASHGRLSDDVGTVLGLGTLPKAAALSGAIWSSPYFRTIDPQPGTLDSPGHTYHSIIQRLQTQRPIVSLQSSQAT
jgi:hypothetical protein